MEFWIIIAAYMLCCNAFSKKNKEEKNKGEQK